MIQLQYDIIEYTIIIVLKNSIIMKSIVTYTEQILLGRQCVLIVMKL